MLLEIFTEKGIVRKVKLVSYFFYGQFRVFKKVLGIIDDQTAYPFRYGGAADLSYYGCQITRAQA